jgi:hypothetical protein
MVCDHNGVKLYFSLKNVLCKKNKYFLKKQFKDFFLIAYIADV